LAGGAVRESWLVMIASFSEGGPQPHTGWLGAIHVGGPWLHVCSGEGGGARLHNDFKEKEFGYI
jgi:hypothetical protein